MLRVVPFLGLTLVSAVAAMAQPPPAGEPGRVFCRQNIDVRLADRASVPERFRRFFGIWSDAAWDLRTCAALIVADIKPDGTASILYIYGPLGSSSPAPSGVLHGTGVIRDGELRFQNSDGTQFGFKPGIADLEGRLTTPHGQNFTAIFKRTP